MLRDSPPCDTREPVLFPCGLRCHLRRGVLFVGNVNNPTNLHGSLVCHSGDATAATCRAKPAAVAGSWDGEEARGSDYYQPSRLGVCGRSGPPPRPPRACTPALCIPPSHPIPLRNLLGLLLPDRYVADLRDVLQRARVFVVPVLWATGDHETDFAHVHGLPTVATVAAAQHAAPAPLGADGVASVWSHRTGTSEKLRVASVAASAEALAAATLHLS